MVKHTRRRVLGAGLAGLVGLAGCSGTARDPGGEETVTATDGGTSGGDPTDTIPSAGAPPTADDQLPVPGSYQDLQDSIVSGGPPKDGIPSIDEPSFAAVADAGGGDLADGDPVFAVEIDGDARAYPQHIVVWHEIVNDRVGGTPITVSYCPLTGTTLGFERGETTFGVSGKLLNSNLVMYDRATDSRWPQVLATAVEGRMQESSLVPVQVAWTSWGRFRERYPDGKVLTQDTGYIRNYGDDPYGGYNPRSGYYQEDRLMFGVRHEDDRLPRKRVVVGARDAEIDPVAVEESTLAQRGKVVGDEVVFVFDATTHQGHAYRVDSGPTVESVSDGTVSLADGSEHPASNLPHTRVTAFDSMWFAWAAFYPDTGLIGR